MIHCCLQQRLQSPTQRLMIWLPVSLLPAGLDIHRQYTQLCVLVRSSGERAMAGAVLARRGLSAPRVTSATAIAFIMCVCVCPPHSPAAHHLWWRCVCVHVFNTVVTHTSCNHRQQSGGGMTRDRRMASTACCVRHPRWLCDPFLHHCGMLWHVEERQGVAGPTSARGVVNIQHG